MRSPRPWFSCLVSLSLFACGPVDEQELALATWSSESAALKADWACEPSASLIPEEPEEPEEPPSTEPPPADEELGTFGGGISVHTLLGLPDPSTSNTSTPEHYLSVKPTYVISYNARRKVPNWVSWELSSRWLGSATRSDNYRVDNTLPSWLTQAQNSDYSGSGFDRGHLCPSADRAKSATENSSTFYLTNMIPQSGNNNRGPWAKLENYARTLAKSGRRLFVIAGGVFPSSPKTVGTGVAVPDSTFKVIVVLNAGQGAANVSPSTRVIAVNMPNSNTQIAAKDDWKRYRVSARSIETLTGLDFLSDVPQSIQNQIETTVDTL
ncbi:MAG: DNA/RNA non-specific endonuclease [Myxococcaceae bacterium]